MTLTPCELIWHTIGHKMFFKPTYFACNTRILHWEIKIRIIGLRVFYFGLNVRLHYDIYNIVIQRKNLN